MKKALFTLAFITATASTATLAEEPSFNYVEGGYSSWEELDGAIVRGSIEITDLVYLNGAYSLQEEDNVIAGEDLEISTARFGVGLKMPIGDNTAVYGQVNYVNYDIDLADESDSQDGYIASAGIRSMLTDTTELYGEIASTTVDSESKTDLTIGGRQYFTNNFGVFAEYVMDDFDEDGYNVGVSFKF